MDDLFTELILFPGDHGNMIYFTNARITEEFFSRVTGSAMKRVVLEMRNMICRTSFVDRSGHIESIVCTKDDRPIDGILSKLSIIRNDTGKFDVSLFTSYISRSGQGNIDKDEGLAFGLTLK